MQPRIPAIWGAQRCRRLCLWGTHATLHQREVEAVGEQREGFHGKGEATRKMNLEGRAGKTADDLVCGGLRADQCRHVKVVDRSGRGLDKTRMDDPHAHAPGSEFEMQDFGQVGERCLCRPVGKSLGQSAVARNA